MSAACCVESRGSPYGHRGLSRQAASETTRVSGGVASSLKSPLRHALWHTRLDGLDGHQVLCRLVGQLRSEAGVEVRLGGRFGGGEHVADRAEAIDDGADLVDVKRLTCGSGESLLSTESVALDLGDPLADHGGIGAGVERRPVALEARVAVLELPERCLTCSVVDLVGA